MAERPGVRSEILAHYGETDEQGRLAAGAGRIERARTGEMLCRHMPPPKARVLDVGGAAGVHALPLARAGYEVHLIDPVPRHVEQAREASGAQADHPLASIREGDARALPEADKSADVVLLLGPLYHLTDPVDRLKALAEARRVLRPGGVVFAAAISRFASLLDGLVTRSIDEPVFAEIVKRDLATGVHENPDGRPQWFTTAYFHRPEELRAEVLAAGLDVVTLVGLEGPLWLDPDLDRRWADAASREQALSFVRTVEAEPSFLGVSAHLLAVGRRDEP